MNAKIGLEDAFSSVTGKYSLHRESNGNGELICQYAAANNTGQQNLTFFGTRGKISNPNRTFKAGFKCVSSFSPSPTVCL